MNRVKARRGKPAGPGPQAAEVAEFAELYAFQYRMEELLMGCERIGLSLGSGMSVEVWGQLRDAPHLGWLRLAVGRDLRAAVAEALLEVGRVHGSHLKVLTREMVLEAMQARQRGDGRAGQAPGD